MQDALIIVVPATLIFFLLYFQPMLTARGRKARIEMDLPYAITYMEALSTTLTLYNTIRGVYEQGDLYGEVSREFGMIVRDVELFGDDLVTAIRNLGQTTPSENLKKLLDDLILMFESGGDLPSFLASRAAHYREVAEKELEMSLKTMEIMAEVYVTAFVAAPIAVIIMVVAENMSGQSTLSSLMPYFFIFLPSGPLEWSGYCPSSSRVRAWRSPGGRAGARNSAGPSQSRLTGVHPMQGFPSELPRRRNFFGS